MRAFVLAAVLLLSAAPVMAPVMAQDQAAPAAPADATAAPAPADAATPPAPPPAQPPAPPAPTNPAMTGPQIRISTSMGDIILQLDAVRAPKSTANVLSYVRDKHYNGTVFYRVVKNFVIQMGSWDAAGKPRFIHPGGVAFEGNNGLKNYRGAAALARGDTPTSANADFFISLGDNPPLNQNTDDTENRSGYAVFGQVVEGMDVVDRIALVPTGGAGPMPGEAPITPVVINKVSIVGEVEKPEPKKAAAKKTAAAPAKK